jgi:hypothetical protein
LLTAAARAVQGAVEGMGVEGLVIGGDNQQVTIGQGVAANGKHGQQKRPTAYSGGGPLYTVIFAARMPVFH